MKKTIMTILMLLCCAVWGIAQGSYPSQQSQSSQDQKSSANQTTVQGCLSSSDGNYVITNRSGKKYQLTGDTSKLSAHVGHEVQITGSKTQSGTSSQSATSSGTMSQSSTSQPTLEVSSMKHISKTCSSSSGARPPQ
jgi:hypothetical protein